LLGDFFALPVAVSQPLLHAAIQAVRRGPFKTITFTDVDILGFEQSRQAILASTYKVALLKGEDKIRGTEGRRSFVVLVTPLSGQFAPTFNRDIEKEFIRISLFQCVACEKIFSDATEEPCVKFEHGPDCKQLPFDDGEMQHFDDETQQMLVNWSCQGVVPADDSGCLRIHLEQCHIADGQDSTSKFEIKDEIAWGLAGW